MALDRPDFSRDVFPNAPEYSPYQTAKKWTFSSLALPANTSEVWTYDLLNNGIQYILDWAWVSITCKGPTLVSLVFCADQDAPTWQALATLIVEHTGQMYISQNPISRYTYPMGLGFIVNNNNDVARTLSGIIYGYYYTQ